MVVTRSGARCAWLAAAMLAAGLHGQEGPPLQKTQDLRTTPDRPQSEGKRLWQISVVTLSVANVLDVHSSLGKRELNSTLAGSSGTLGTRGIALKSGLQGGLLGAEYLLIRKHSNNLVQDRPRPKLYRTLSIINFVSSAVLTGVAAHNYTIPRTAP